jgi:hypothetical protein
MAKLVDKSSQFNLLLQQKYGALNMIDKSNEVLDDKASKIMQASSLIIALTGLLASPFVGASLSGVSGILVVSILLAFMLMVGLSIVSVSPKMHYLPGSQNWDKNFEQYIMVTAEDSFEQILSDCIQTIDLLSETNSNKAKLVRISASLLLLQIGALLIFIFLSVS